MSFILVGAKASRRGGSKERAPRSGQRGGAAVRERAELYRKVVFHEFAASHSNDANDNQDHHRPIRPSTLSRTTSWRVVL
ncbi:hypothetical protein predicted by Glimmer/Critica [Sorangium cellulosum So ce56]|uniref:Uncharacterized protein n=1 Tax=Sorangium cellulosum (strain So ce56) TaxID=448385 RepID=A9ES59_SORC5|nr:hypothetical protein [Sorangium cellulosum]CAN97357.1 hypothetical protein predicted by Glimmer/Critica [Sorangium cellulosum So ce56]